MSDLSSNETLEPLKNTNSNDAHDANSEDWESIIDFEMKNGKEDANMEGSNENELSFDNRLQAEQDNPALGNHQTGHETRS
jgi:hypothetical protein